MEEKKERPSVDERKLQPPSVLLAERRKRTADIFPAGLLLFTPPSMMVFCQSAHKHKETKGEEISLVALSLPLFTKGQLSESRSRESEEEKKLAFYSRNGLFPAVLGEKKEPRML